MGIFVCGGAMCTCSFGAAPSTFVVLPENKCIENMPFATIMDNKPMVNIMPFGVCNTLTNPAVAAATSAALGVLTPQPCIPVIPAPWIPGAPTVLLANKPALSDSSQLLCAYGGIIMFSNPGQVKVQIP